MPKARRVLALTAAEKAAITAQAIAAMILATTNQRGRQTHTSTEVILATILATILVTAATILVTTNQNRREIHTSTEVSPKILARSLKEARKNAEDQARELVIKMTHVMMKMISSMHLSQRRPNQSKSSRKSLPRKPSRKL